ncbi:MAG TPA: hypothetical protein VFH37_02585 [Candidatus Saccharimonadales bacterium]|nr:hypothetical protein [Candidatus Saccharimonadales bacterium]
MSKALSKLLDYPEEVISKIINQLEKNNGYPSHDIRLVAQNMQKSRLKITQLGLDPDDTTTEELYQALIIKYENDARRFDEHFGLYGGDYDSKVKKAVELVSRNVSLPDRWVLKSTAAKQLLRQHPPKQVMKTLSYRSVDSFVKRERLSDIYLAVEFIESPAWNRAHFKLASQLGSTAFERRQLELCALTGRWGNWQSTDLYLSSADYGVLGLLPTEETSKMSLLALVVLLVDELGLSPSLAANFSPTVAWWSDTDSLIVALDTGPLAFNLKDIVLNHSLQRSGKRHLMCSQRHFWKELLSRYENQALDEEEHLPNFESPTLNIAPPLDQPAFEYVEDI